MKSIVSTIFLLAGTFVPSLSETGEHGLGSLRGSEHTVRLNKIVGEWGRMGTASRHKNSPFSLEICLTHIP